MDIWVRSIPDEIAKVLIREQAKQKEQRGILQYSLSATIIKIIKDWEKCHKEEKK